jgi:hypothetical protein
MRRHLPVTTFCLLAACQTVLPPALATPQGHGLQRVWIETLGLE